MFHVAKVHIEIQIYPSFGKNKGILYWMFGAVCGMKDIFINFMKEL